MHAAIAYKCELQYFGTAAKYLHVEQGETSLKQGRCNAVFLTYSIQCWRRENSTGSKGGFSVQKLNGQG